MLRFGSTLQLSWDWRAAGNFMFGGTGSGLMLMAALLYLGQPLPIEVGATALALVAVGLFLVWLEIGRPWRFINVFFHPQTSWMTREASVAVVLFVTAAVGIALAQPAFVALAGLAGLAFLFCQAQILKASKGIPSWREPAVVPLMVATGLAEGTALLLLVSLVSGHGANWLHYALLLFVAARAALWARYLGRLFAASAPRQTLDILGALNPAFLALGGALPIALITTAWLMPARGVLLGAAALATLLAGWYLKFTLVARAAQNQGYAIGRLNKGRPNPRPPVRRGG